VLTVKPVNDPVDCGPGGERWRELVEKGLRGRPFSDLVAEAAEGFPIRPLEAAAKPLASLFQFFRGDLQPTTQERPR